MLTNNTLKSEQNNPDYISLIGYCRSILIDSDIEQLQIIFLDTKNQIIDHKLLEKGNRNSINIIPDKLSGIITTLPASAIILVHNHPSDNIKPSKADINTTKKLYLLCQSYNIQLKDHIIIGKTDYFSFAQSGIIHSIQDDNV